MWILMLTLRSIQGGVIQTACYGPYATAKAAHLATENFNLHDWTASIHEVKAPPPSEDK